MTSITTTAAKFAIRNIGKFNKSNICNNIKSSKPSCQKVALFSAEARTKTKDDDVVPNPSDFVSGVTQEDLDNDPKLQAFFVANFPDHFGGDDDDNDFKISYEYLSKIKEGRELFAKEISEAAGETASVRQEGSNGSIPSGEINVTTFPSELSRNIRPFFTYKRDLETEEGSRKCRILRESTNMIPGIVFGGDPTKNILSTDESHKILVKTPMRIIQRELDRFTASNFESKVYDLTVLENDGDNEGEIIRVMPRDVNFHPIYNKIYCCNYIRYHPGRLIKIPIVYINEEESPAMKRGGFIAPFNRYVPCLVEDGVKIPDGIELDCTGARLKEVIRRDRLIFPDGVTPGKKVKDDFLIGTIFGRKADIGPQVQAEG